MIKVALSYYVVGFVFFCLGWAGCAIFTVSSQESRKEEKLEKRLSEMDNKDEGNKVM